eukprot:517765_1
MATLWTYLVSISSLCSIISIIATISIFYHLILDKTSSTHLHRPVKYYSIASATSFAIAASTSTICIMYSTKNDLHIPQDKQRSTIAIALVITNLFFWAIGVLFLYLLFISRLNRAYKGSMFHIPSCVYSLLYILLALLLILNIADIVLLTAAYYNEEIKFIYMPFDTYSAWSTLILISAECIHLLISTFVVYMFISRLLRLIGMMSEDNMNSKSDSTDIVDPNYYGSVDTQIREGRNISQYFEFSDHQFSILHVVSKQSILSASAIISSQLCFATSVLLTTAFDDEDDTFYKITVSINDTVFVLDCAINCLCILMTFSFHQKLYLRVCGTCDKCLRLICTKYVKEKLRRQYNTHQHKLLLLDEGIEFGSKSNSRDSDANSEM